MSLNPSLHERYSPRLLAGGVALIALAAILMAIVPSTFAVGNAPSEPLEKRIEKLIDQLGDKNFHIRQKAQSELLKIGFPAIDALNDAANHDDLEIAERARFLVKLIHVEWIKDSDPLMVRLCLRDYEELEPEERLRRIKALSELSGGSGMMALCRLVRFEKSIALSKQAALSAIFLPDPAEAVWPKRAKQITETLEGSPRSGAKWLRTLVKSHDEPEAALAEWEQYIAEETAARESSGVGSDQILVALLRREVLLLEKLHRHEQALTVARKQISYERGTPETLIDLLGWLAKQQLWEMVDEVATRFSRQIDQNVSLLYAVADARAIQGKKDDAEKLAERACQLSPEQMRLHLQAAYQLQKLGRFAWMEREYRTLIQSPPTRSEPLQASLLLSEHLHDQGKDRAAADVLQPLVGGSALHRKQMNEMLQAMNRTSATIQARMFSFSACAYEKEGKKTEALRDLRKAIEQDETDADVLIGLFRLTKGNDKEHKNVVEKIREAVDAFRGRIESDPDEPMYYNQFAWLVANTEGDFDEALRASHKSLELSPGEAGYLDTLGHCYFAKGDYENAVAYEGRAAEIDPYSGLLRTALERFKAAQAKATPDNK